MRANLKTADANDDRALIIAYWHEWEIRGADRQIVLCVETALELDPGRDGFDRGKVDELLHQASKLMKASPSPIDFIRIVQTQSEDERDVPAEPLSRKQAHTHSDCGSVA